MREINIPESDGDLYIADSAFNGCDALTSFDAPRQLCGLSPNAFGELERPFQFKLHPDSKALRNVNGMILSRDGKTICAYFGPKTGELVIPEGVERLGQVFGSISKGADFETIRLPKSLRVIYRQAFMLSKSLKRVELPPDSALEEIGDSAFRGCEALESFTWPKTLKTIGNSAFSRCRLQEFVGGPALEKIDAYAFSDCETLTKIELPSGLREIGNGAFSECGATSIKIPASVQIVGETAFTMGALEKFEVEEGSETLKVVDGALLSKDGKSLRRVPSALKLTSYKIPDGVEIIERAALGGNVTLESVEIPATVKTIGPNAFYRCVALKKLSIPASVEKMDGAFNRCDGLEQFEVDPKNPVYKSVNGGLLSADGKTFYKILAVERDAEAEAKAAAEIAATEGVDAKTSKPIYKNPVYRVPDGVETIVSSAFSDEVGMRNAFTEIVLPESVKEIGGNAFARCKRLEKALIPKNVAKISGGAFKYCDALKTIEISPENPNYRLENGLLLSKDGKTFYEALVDCGETVLKIPDGVEGIAKTWVWSAFESGPTYAEVVLPETLTSLGEGSFNNWENLTSITIPKNVKKIEARAFCNCPNLAEVVLQSRDTLADAEAFYNYPEGPKPKIRVEDDKPAQEQVAEEPETSQAPQNSELKGNQAAVDGDVSDAFEWREVRQDEVWILGVRDKKATSVVIPKTLGGAPVKTIGSQVFAGMRELKTVRLPKYLETIELAAFDGCVKLENIEFAKDENGGVASNLQRIKALAFRGCVSLKSFAAPDSLVEIGASAFLGCSALETATAGKNLEKIEVGAFDNCGALKRVDCSSCEKLTQIANNAFANCGALSTFDAPKSLRLVAGNAFGNRTTPFNFNVHPESAFLKTVDGCVVTEPDNRLIAYFGERSGELVVPDGVEEIGPEVFSGAGFETVRFPKSLRRVNNFAFAGCGELKNVEIPEDSALKHVGARSFFNCKALETFAWPKSLKQIGEYAFDGCAALKSLTGATSLERIGDSAFANCKALATVELPSGLREIGPCAFLNDEFTSIKIPASVKVLGPAGVACTGLEKIEVEEGNEILKVVDGALLSKDGKTLHRLPPALKTTSYKIPDGVEIVGRSALGGNVTLETVELPASVTTIQRDAFYRCERLKAIAIPAKTEQIDKDAFVFCDALERFEVDPDNAVYKSENGALLSKDGKTFYGVVAVERDPSAEPLVVEPKNEDEEPRSVAAYKSYVYRVPDGVTTISNGAFYDSRRTRNAFKEIVLPEGLTVVGANVFNTCERLETIRVPASVTHLGSWTTVLSPDSTPSAPFPQLVFASNRALKTFEVAPESKTYRSEDGMLLSADGKICYAVCANKDRSVWKVPDGVVRLASAATKATEIVLPESLERVSTNTFRDCENLTSITIPKNVRQIEAEAFYNCPRLAEVVLKSSDTVYFPNSFVKVAPNLTIRVEENEPAKENAETPTAPQVNAVDPANAPQAKTAQAKAVEPANAAQAKTVETANAAQAKTVEPAKKIAVDVSKTLEQNGFEWREENDGATITGVKDETATRLVIPETLGGLPVKAVGDVAFARMSGLKTVRISRNLETIGWMAFGGCVNLETIEFAKDENGGVASRLREIRAEAFKGCAALKSFAAPDSLVKLGGGAFCKCPSLETAKLGKSLQDVASHTFANCVALNNVDTTACEALTSIQEDAFLNCGALSSFDAPKSLRYVGATAFAGRSTPLAFNLDPESEFLKLVDGCLITIADEEVNDKQLIAYFGERSGELVVPEGVVNVFISAFAGADFETVRLPKSVRIVNNEAFKDCKSLKRVVIPEDSELQSIGYNAFGGCASLETFDWPKSLKVICARAFGGCESLKSFAGATSVEEIRDSAFWNCRSLATVELPSGLRQVGAFAFGDAGYETLKIPASLQVLGESAFASSSPREKYEVEEGSETLKIVDGALLSKDGKTFYRLPSGLNATSRKVPEGVEVIEDGAFRGNATLETVELPSTLRAIKKNAFYRCLALKEIAIPAKTGQIDVDAFAGCDVLERFEVDPNNAAYKSENGALLSADGKTFYKLIAVERDPNAPALLHISSIENAALRSETPGETLRFDALRRAYRSLIYRVPDGVTTISDGAFDDSRKARNGFKEIVLPEGLVVIGANAFGSCSRLETLRIPASVAQFGASSAFPTTTLFTDCDALKTFEVAPENKTFRSEDGVLLSADGSRFYGVVANKKRSVLKIPAGVEHLTGDRNFGDPGKIVFPDSLTSIPQGKFRNLANLTTATISKNIYLLNRFTFVDCPRLAEIVLRSQTTIYEDDAFLRCAPNLTIRVEEREAPEPALENVKTAPLAVASVSPTVNAEVRDEGALITGVYDKNATTIEIPETINGLPTRTIAANAFAEAPELRTVRIPASVETIGIGAFRGCVKLEKIEFAKSADGKSESALKTVGMNAFLGCRSLKSFEAPDSLVRIVYGAFVGCSALETVTLGQNVAVIESGVFADCASLRRVDLSKAKKLEYFDAKAFGETFPDIEIVYPVDHPRFTSNGFLLSQDGKRINAYLGKRSGEVAIPEGVESIENGFFGRRSEIETIRLPKSLRSVGALSFYRCESLKRVVIPEDSALETIGANAFLECYALERFDWPKSLKTIGISAFAYCRSLKSFVGATSVQKIENSAFCGCALLTEVELPNGLLEIGPSAFAECGFTSIKIPASVRVMGDAALAVTPLKTIEVEEGNEAVKVVDGALLSKDGKSFFRLPPALKLKDFKIPEGVEIIERAALGGNETLESVEIPASVTTIERNAFYRNSSLTEIFIPARVAALDDAFPLCDALERFEVDPENAVYKSENGALLSKDGKTFYRIVAVERDPNGAPITLEADEHVSKATKRDETSRSIPAYKNDVYVVPDGVATIAENAFSDLRRTRNAFTDIVLPQSLERIEARAFQHCSRLETLRIPANVSSVGDCAFLGCDALKTFEVAPENRVLSVKDGLMLSDGGKTFCCVVADKNRRVLKLPEGVERAQSNAVASKKFAELVLPESLIEIKASAFANCENLTKVAIPQNVRYIGGRAFSNSPKLAEIVLKSSATKYEANAFQDVAPNCEVRVDETQTSKPKDDTNGEGSEAAEERTLTLEEAEKIYRLAFEGGEATIVGVINQDAHSVVVPRKIGEYAVTRIADSAFANMHYLVEAQLPSTIREIGAYAFVNCRHLEQVVIPSATESVGVGAFTNCRSLRAVGVSLDNKAFKVVRGSLLSSDGKTLYAYPTARVVDKIYEVPEGVETIAPKAFAYNLYVKEVKFPWTLKRIEKEAFEACEALEAVQFFPVVNRLETIGESAFYRCQALKSINLPDGIRRIERHAFADSGLETVGFYPVDLEARPGLTIETTAFRVSNLTAFEIPETLQKLGLQAVGSSRKIALKLPPNLKTPIGWADEIVCAGISSFEVDPSCNIYRVVDGVLLSKDGKTLYRYPKGRDASEYVVPDGVETIAKSAFEGASLRTIRLPKTLKTLESGALARIAELESIEIPDGVETCGANLFARCSKLATAKLPASLRNCDLASAFNGCSALAAVELAPGFTLAKTVDGALLSLDGSTLYFCPPNNGATEFNIPESVVRVGDSAFQRHRTLKTVRFSKNVETVGVGAFQDCKSLETLTLNEGLIALKTNAFSGCSALKAVDIPKSVLNLGGSAFCGCSRLTTVKIPAKASRVEGSFWGCAALRAIEVDPENPEYKSVDGVLLSKDGRTLYEYPMGKGGEEYRVPDGVVEIVANAFRAEASTTRPKKIVLPNSVQIVKMSAFTGRENFEVVASEATKFGDFQNRRKYKITVQK